MVPYDPSYLKPLAALLADWDTSGDFDPAVVAASIVSVTEQSPSRLLLAVDDQGVLVGYAQAGPLFLVGFAPAVELKQLLIKKTHRGQGIGSLLLQAVETWARDQGYAAVKLHSRIHRADAHRFYLNHGYTEVKRSVYFEKLMAPLLDKNN